MWPGSYGEFGSRKYLLASLDQSLKRLGLDYIDIFYSHRYDPGTPLEETMGALAQAVRSGKAVYVGISNYNAAQTAMASEWLRSQNIPLVVNQVRYNILDRHIEGGLFEAARDARIGVVAFSPLAQGLLTDRYLDGIPNNSRAGKTHGTLLKSAITPNLLAQLNRLNELAFRRGQSLAGMALSWVLRNQTVTTVLVGASQVAQIEDSVHQVVTSPAFTHAELAEIDATLAA